jgi:hypothetical protein
LRGKKPQCTEVWLCPCSIGQSSISFQPAPEFSQAACLTTVMGLELFLRFPRGKPSLMRERERERERKGQPERSAVARPWDGGFSWRTDSIRVPDSHGHVPRQPFPVWHNLY